MENNLVNSVGNAVEAFIYSKIKDTCTTDIIRDVCNERISCEVSDYFAYEFRFDDVCDINDHIDSSTIENAVDMYCDSNVRGMVEDYVNDNLERAVEEMLSDTVRYELGKFFASDEGKNAIIDAIKGRL